MSQYHSAYKSSMFEELSRGLSGEEYDKAVAHLDFLRFENGWKQDLPETR